MPPKNRSSLSGVCPDRVGRQGGPAQAGQKLEQLPRHLENIAPTSGDPEHLDARDVRHRCSELHGHVRNCRTGAIRHDARSTAIARLRHRVEGSLDKIAGTQTGKRQRIRRSAWNVHRVAIVRGAVLDRRLMGTPYAPTAAGSARYFSLSRGRRTLSGHSPPCDIWLAFRPGRPGTCSRGRAEQRRSGAAHGVPWGRGLTGQRSARGDQRIRRGPPSRGRRTPRCGVTARPSGAPRADAAAHATDQDRRVGIRRLRRPRRSQARSRPSARTQRHSRGRDRR